MFQSLLLQLRDLIWGVPLLCFVVGVAVTATVALRFIQFTKFFSSWPLILAADEGKGGELTPFQAFLNALSASMGNGTIAGVATAVHTGGPGALFWILVVGTLGMVLRFCEVFLSTSFTAVHSVGNRLGGPFIYLQKVPGGATLAVTYAACCLLFSFSSGTAMQCNSISMAVNQIAPTVPLWVTGVVLAAFVLYIFIGGARRIAQASSIIAPLKVALFFMSCTGVLVYYWASIIPAIMLCFKAAFYPQAIAGAAMGVTLQRMISVTFTRTINATESGLGTAAIIYGATSGGGSSSNRSINDGLSAMLGTFISTHLVCVMTALAIVVSGVWQGSATGSALTVEAFQTVYGAIGGWIVTLLTILFGIGVFVAYGFIGRQCWFFLTGHRYEKIFIALFCAFSFWGAVANVSVVWAAIDVVNGGILVINLFAILWLLPYIRQQVLPVLQKR